MALKVLIVEDHELTRFALGFALERDPRFEVLGSCPDGEQAILMAMEGKPDLVFMDITLPKMDGIIATQEIKTRLPKTKVIILTGHNSHEQVIKAMAAGANAYCIKDIRLEQLLHVASMIMDGGIWLDPTISDAISKHFGGNEAHMSPVSPLEDGQQLAYLHGLTQREMDVLMLMMQGHRNADIAKLLSISANTVKTHVCKIIQKLNVTDRTQAVVKALQQTSAPKGWTGADHLPLLPRQNQDF